MSFELRQLKHALAVAEHGSFAQAALSLHLSQSALSRSVQALERIVGSPIFVRSGQGILVTDAGLGVLRQGREMLALATEIDKQFLRNRSLQGGSLGIGVGTAASEASAVEAARRFAAESPKVRLELRPAFRTDLLLPLRTGRIDVLLADSTLLTDEPDLEIEHLAPQPLVVFARPGHPLAGRGSISLAETFCYPTLSLGRIQPRLLAPLLQEQARAQLQALQQRPLPAVMCNSLPMIERLMLSSDAVGAATPTALRRQVEAGALVPLLAPPWLLTPFGTAHLRSRPLSGAANSFREHLRAAHAGLVADDHALLCAWFDAARGEPA